MKKSHQKLTNLFLRYFLLVLVAIPNLALFYLIFTPLTLYLVYFLLNLLFEVSIRGNILLVSNQFPIELIPACVAGAAYYLLFILNLSIPDIKIIKRIKMILLSFSVLLFLNVLRIFLLSLVFINGNPWFDIAHKIFWYLGSTIFVVGIWFAEVKILKIKQIPFFSDMKYLFKQISRK